MNTKISLITWVQATFLGWFLGMIIFLTMSVAFDALGIENLQFFIGVGMGAGVGLVQALRLRKAIPVTFKWIWASVLGLGIPFLAIDLVRLLGGVSFGDYYLPISVAVGSICLGILQYRILAAYYAKSSMWILASFSGWVAASITTLGIDYVKYITTHNWTAFFINIFLILAGGAVLGWVTGLFLRRIQTTHE